MASLTPTGLETINGNWEPSNAVQSLQTELEALKSRVAALEAAAEGQPSA